MAGIEVISTGLIDPAPEKLWLYDLQEQLKWYEENLCNQEILDPRGYQVKFGIERFPHMIKLRDKISGEDVKKAAKIAQKIKDGTVSHSDFGGYHEERVRTLPWVMDTIKKPTAIVEVDKSLGKVGDTLYIKEFDRRMGHRFKVVVCKTAGSGLLVPVTSHPENNGRLPDGHTIVWTPPIK